MYSGGFQEMEGGRSEPSYMATVAYQDGGKAILERVQLYPRRNFDSLLVAYAEGDPGVAYRRGF